MSAIPVVMSRIFAFFFSWYANVRLSVSSLRVFHVFNTSEIRSFVTVHFRCVVGTVSHKDAAKEFNCLT